MSPVLGAPAGVGLGYAVPSGWGANWRAARNTAASTRTEVAIFGDSTTWGAGQNYSWVQRLRDRSIAAGYADGGKGVFGLSDVAIAYDAPEISGIVSNGWNWGQDAAFADYLVGEGIASNTSGQVAVVQGKITGSGGTFRLWYVNRVAGSFTVSIDGAAATTITTTGSGAVQPFYVTGLAAGTHTATITNTANAIQVIAPAFMNGTGVVYQKYARVGATQLAYFDPIGWWFGGGTRGGRDSYPVDILGLAATGGGSNLVWQQARATYTGHPTCSLAILNLGFNDLTTFPVEWSKDTNYTTGNRVIYAGVIYQAIIAAGGAAQAPPNVTYWKVADFTASGDYDLNNYIEGIHLFCRLAQAAGADPLVISGEFAMNTNSYVLGGRMAAAVRSTSLACGAAWCDFMFPALGRPNAITGQLSQNNPHIGKVGYVAQADFLWDKVLSL